LAGDRQSRRDREASADRRQRLIYIAAAGTLVVVALIIVIGLFVTRFLPPRAHIVTVEERSYNASSVVHRGNYLVTFEGQDSVLADVASVAVDVLVFEETVRRRGPALVGPITQAQVDAEMQRLLGFDPLESAFTPIPGGADDADDDADDAAADDTENGATGESDPEADPPRTDLFPLPPEAPRSLSEAEQRDFANALAAVLSSTGLSIEEFELIAEARVVRGLLNRHFDAVIGLGGEQLRLSRIQLSDPTLAAELQERAAAGEPFEDLVLEANPDAAPPAEDEEAVAGDLGWFTLDLLPDDVAEALAGLEAGGVSEVVVRGQSFEVFKITEIDPDRAWEDAARQLLVRDQVDAWEELARTELVVEIDLSDDEEVWIIERVVSHVTGQVAR
jgi:hypothetical protein